MLKPYKYKLPSKRFEEPRLIPLPPKDPMDDEGLTGWINGLTASKLEERFARALRGKQLAFKFKFDIRQPGREFKNNIDFIVNTGFTEEAVEIFGPFTHESESDRRRDEDRIAVLNPVLIQLSIEPIKVVWFYDTDTQELATNIVDDLFF